MDPIFGAPRWCDIVATKRAAVAESAALRRHCQRTHCKHGHAYTPDNTYIDPRGRPECRTCRRAWQRDHNRAATNPDLAPIAPLVEYLRRLTGRQDLGCRPLAHHCRISQERALRWLTDRYIDIYDADHAAVALGEHPWTIWPDWFDRARATFTPGAKEAAPCP